MFEKKVAFIGDSIMKGVIYENERFQISKNSFVKRFAESTNFKIENYAKFGMTSGKLLKKLDSYIERKPDLVFFQVGGNDCNYRWNLISGDPFGEHSPVVPREDYARNLAAVYRKFQDAGVGVIALNLPPLFAERFFAHISQGLSERNILKWLGAKSVIYSHHETYSSILEDVSTSFGIDVIDIRSEFLLRGRYHELICEDGMHPSEAAQSIIYRGIINYLIGKTVWNVRQSNKSAAVQMSCHAG